MLDNLCGDSMSKKNKTVPEPEPEEDDDDEGSEVEPSKGKFVFLLFILILAFAIYTFFAPKAQPVKQPAAVTQDVEYAPPVRKVVEKKKLEAYPRAKNFKDSTQYVVEYGDGLPKTRVR